MSLSAGDILTGIQFIQGVVSKVKDNREDLLRVSDRLQHILNVLEENQQRDLLRPEEYNDALTAISNLVQRAQRATQKQLKRSLGARTWNRDDIATELRRICDDVDTYLSVHTIRTLDVMHAASDQSLASLSSNVEVIMVKLAEIDIRLNTPAGPKWSPHILSKATGNVRDGRNDEQGDLLAGGGVTRDVTSSGAQPQARQETEPPLQVRDINLQNQSMQALAEAGRTSIQIKSLRKDGHIESDVTISGIKIDATVKDIKLAIAAQGFQVPDDLKEDPLLVTVTDAISEFDTTAPGGLQIAKSMPLIWWWNKYNAYHGIAHATTPGHSLATLGDDGKAIMAADVEFHFHRTLRVPETSGETMLPLDLGQFPLVPVSKYAPRLPDSIRKKGGFLMPMFEREALWISFGGQRYKRTRGPAIKVSVGGVNVITGIAKDYPTPPSQEQDYVVAGLQPWLDGIMTESGIVRQFVAMAHGQGYTVEEQITGKAEHGGFQFDIFPRRDEPPEGASFYLFNTANRDMQAKTRNTRSLDSHMTPAELDVPLGSAVGLLQGKSTWDKTWTLSGYRHRINSGCLLADYIDWDSMLMGAGMPQMGLAPGGKISQKIYRDRVSPRMYDEDNGHRFHVHILTPEAWEVVTGVLPQITPITAETYKQHNIPWYSISDGHVPGLSTASKDLGNLQSVAQLDEAKKFQTPELVDPDRPPACSLHLRTTATCLFRPCSHTACSACLGTALLQGSQCPKCASKIDRFVGMKNPVAKVSEVINSEDSEDVWVVSQMEELALQAVESGNITIIHLDEDRVAPLHRLDREPSAFVR